MTDGFETEPIAEVHRLDRFDCGSGALDRWLQDRALDNERRGATRTFVHAVEATVLGYYSLAASSVERRRATGRARRNMPDPVPAMLLARLAVDRSVAGRGLGRALLRDAMLRTLQAAEVAGIRLFLVHAADEAAREWYRQFDFEESPTDPLHLMVLLDDVRRALGQA